MKAKIWKRGASARKAKEVMELQKLEEEKAAKARRRSVEAAELNALISQKLERRHSHDGTISQNEDGQLTPNGSSKGRRKSITGKPITGEAISRKGQFDPKEVDLINKYVKKRDGEMAERRESIRRSSLDAEAIATAARRALAELDLEENDEEEPGPPQKERPSTGSTTSDQSTSTGIIPPPSAARPRARRKSAEVRCSLSACRGRSGARSEGSPGLHSPSPSTRCLLSTPPPPPPSPSLPLPLPPSPLPTPSPRLLAHFCSAWRRSNAKRSVGWKRRTRMATTRRGARPAKQRPSPHRPPHRSAPRVLRPRWRVASFTPWTSTELSWRGCVPLSARPMPCARRMPP